MISKFCQKCVIKTTSTRKPSPMINDISKLKGPRLLWFLKNIKSKLLLKEQYPETFDLLYVRPSTWPPTNKLKRFFSQNIFFFSLRYLLAKLKFSCHRDLAFGNPFSSVTTRVRCKSIQHRVHLVVKNIRGHVVCIVNDYADRLSV